MPDNIEDEPRKIAASVSPTNVGLLLNARQVANEFGYLTVPEMVELTQKTLATIARLRKYRGHLLNWYDTHTLRSKAAIFCFLSGQRQLGRLALDAASWLPRKPAQTARCKSAGQWPAGPLYALVQLRALPKRTFSRCETQFQTDDWLTAVLNFPEELLEENLPQKSDSSPDVTWFCKQAHQRVRSIHELVEAYMPWKLPEFAALRNELAGSAPNSALPGAGVRLDEVPLQQLPDLISQLEARLDHALPSVRNGDSPAVERLLPLLAQARRNTLRLIDEVRQIGLEANSLANAMDFSFLLDKQRMLLSVGFDAQTEELQPYCYNLLATEPRTAVFIAIAKEDIPQDCWFRLDRPFTSDEGRPVLLSWTGTMFEYLMPTVWMRSYPNTLLDRASQAAVRSQQAYATSKGILWGISESACSKRNEAGDYHYEAFGVPSLAIRKSGAGPLVVSPYSTFLALNVDRQAALANLHKMEAMGWFGSYGFYEAADYASPRTLIRGARYELVRSWMVHHQGMSLLSLANVLCDNVVQRWFHSDRRVQATELLLQEKPVSHVRAA